MTVSGLGTIMGIHFLHDGKKQLKSFRDRHEDPDLSMLFWLEMMEAGFWITQRGSVAVILGTPWGELQRFSNCVFEFLEKYKGLLSLRPPGVKRPGCTGNWDA
jgi:glutamate-1-semialdehyde 2,1-aminomutase